ncbi:MAG TPA: Nif3-like dinuclear metal center hexameric protein [Balneola sp.]|jgi:dinuclear metal center YbgI/SA1388 family protein|nr:Nif3-like dinuclear metal center hexameric protein [Balneola sp.]MAO76377.1 Nif3-like dinuclear metal center hexameric protein [Balneola sp.]MBF65568.1 Nif3-like dinuclear metal center hexameric protein [Balneola sp.]HAH51702.1 Nif3-like dinuclear metal center hexameric protein [Balneola sp.]HBZ39666.1 Nif3-like dinuclear metal center hexameric protein [Balneola sp.]|tara:strand:+ start:2944 stop:4005 length:1062 start_codon:yes stop_codon:yes gene_type:complete
MATKIRHISTFLNQWAPPGTKMDYDNVGLLVGDPDAEVTNVLTCLDITDAVVAEAIQNDCELIVAHHPLIFSKIGKINPTDEQGRIIYKLIKNDIGLLVAHTNLDAALDGVSFVLANMLGLDDLSFLTKNYSISKKISLVSSVENSDSMVQLLNYYSAEDVHHYSVESREKDLRCFEATIDKHHLPALRKGLKKEGLLKDGALQITDLVSTSNNFGMGVIGQYPEEGLGKNEFLHLVSQALNVKAIRFSGDVNRIKTVAVCGGAGVFLKEKAIKAGADAFVTADIKYHDYFTEQENFLLVDVGHYESEFPVAEALKKELSEAFDNLKVSVTEIVTNPMQTYVSESKPQSIQTS